RLGAGGVVAGQLFLDLGCGLFFLGKAVFVHLLWVAGLALEKLAADPLRQGQPQGLGGLRTGVRIVRFVAGEPCLGHILGYTCNARQHFALFDPVTRPDGEIRVGLLLVAGIGDVYAALFVRRVDPSAPAVVELMDHLAFVEWQCGCLGFAGRVVKQVAVVRHVQHALKTNTPGIVFRLGYLAVAVLDGLTYQDWGLAVQLFGQFGIALAAEDRAGAGVGVDQREFVRRQREPAALVSKMIDLGGEADNPRRLTLAERQQAELVTAVNTREDSFAV